ALPAEVVAEAGAGLGLAVEVVGDVGEAVSMAVGRAMVDDLVIVCGSFYVVGAARAALLAVEH
ncbi:MAG: bifunctional folylpolyglutamate synthase/dihydrofolate synthase, partial [Acidimicrobiales bacterium]